MEDDIEHGIDGWVLEDYSWDAGVGRFVYARDVVVGNETKHEVYRCTRAQRRWALRGSGTLVAEA